MKYEFTELAKAELETARDHYDNERDGLGREFVLDIQSVVERVARRPLAYPPYPRTPARRALAKRFPYMVVFIVVAASVRIVAVAHQHRMPRYWRDRM